jgi:hypothetical protein
MEYQIQTSGNIVELVLPSGALTANREYTITIAPGLRGVSNSYEIESVEEISFWFTSFYCPAFTTVGRIRLELGPVIDKITDDAIYRMIHKNSLDAIMLLNMATGKRYDFNAFGCTWETAPTDLIRYVECKTAYDLLSMIDILKSGSPFSNGGGGDETKTLGDLTIKYGGTSSSGSSGSGDDNKKKQLFDCWNSIIRTMGNINVAVRGLYDVSKGYAHPVMYPINRNVITDSYPYQNPRYTTGHRRSF